MFQSSKCILLSQKVLYFALMMRFNVWLKMQIVQQLCNNGRHYYVIKLQRDGGIDEVVVDSNWSCVCGDVFFILNFLLVQISLWIEQLFWHISCHICWAAAYTSPGFWKRELRCIFTFRSGRRTAMTECVGALDQSGLNRFFPCKCAFFVLSLLSSWWSWRVVASGAHSTRSKKWYIFGVFVSMCRCSEA